MENKIEKRQYYHNCDHWAGAQIFFITRTQMLELSMEMEMWGPFRTFSLAKLDCEVRLAAFLRRARENYRELKKLRKDDAFKEIEI